MSNKVYTIEELKKKISKILSVFPVEKAILFGSYAKGEADSKSDVDLVIKLNELDGFLFYGILETLVTSLKKDVDLIEQREIIQGGKVDKEILKTGVVIYGE